ncbi:MAG: hypothetical protein Tsb0014_35500 [Pleurocapsa sp.]
MLERGIELKQALVDFVYESEGEMAVALESYAAEKGAKNSYGIKQQNLTIDLFITEGKIEDRTPLDIFLAQNQDLTNNDIELIKLWKNNFIGLFEIKKITGNCYELMNWLTAKKYTVFSHFLMPKKETRKWQVGEILVTIIAPIGDREWFFFSDRIIKGRLSKPKLAVAVGEFRDNYPEFLYADTPQLLEQAWESVAVYHQKFVDYFGSDRVTLPGYKLNQKIGDLQQLMSREKLAQAGIDDSKSLSEMLAESGTTEAEFAQTANDLGADTEAVTKIIENKNKLSMVTPKVDLPPEIKEAETVTVFSHPRWGQIFLPNYEKFTNFLTDNNSDAEITKESSFPFIRKYLEKPEANYYVWQQLKQEYPQALEIMLQNYCDDRDFNLETDLDRLLLKYQKSSTPQLPSIASVPIHLNDLFETAVAQVQKTKSKTKKKKKKKGFL